MTAEQGYSGKRTALNTLLLFAGLVATASSLAMWSQATSGQETLANHNVGSGAEIESPVMLESRSYPTSTTVPGTIVAMRSITLQNEIPGTVQTSNLVPGMVVDAGDLLVAFDVSVERAEFRAAQAEAAHAAAIHSRTVLLANQGAASQEELDEAHADWRMASARVARIEAIIERKMIRAPFQSRVGLSNVHTGQYLDDGTVITTLIGISSDVLVDFAVSQDVQLSIGVGTTVLVHTSTIVEQGFTAEVVGVDAHVDPATQKIRVRARLPGSRLLPGTLVEVSIPHSESTGAFSLASAKVDVPPAPAAAL